MAMIGRRGFRGLVDRYNGDARAAREHLLAADTLGHRNRCHACWKEVIRTGNVSLTYHA